MSEHSYSVSDVDDDVDDLSNFAPSRTHSPQAHEAISEAEEEFDEASTHCDRSIRFINEREGEEDDAIHEFDAEVHDSSMVGEEADAQRILQFDDADTDAADDTTTHGPSNDDAAERQKIREEMITRKKENQIESEWTYVSPNKVAIPPVDGDIAALTNPLHLHQLLTARQMEHISHLQTRMKDESHQLRTTYVDDFHQTLDTFQHHTLDTFRCEFEKRDKLVATWAHEFRDRLQSQKDEECNAMRQTYETRIHLLQDRINATTRNDDTRLHIAEETSTKLAERLTESNQLNHNLRMELDEANASVVASSKRLVESESTIRELQLLVSSQESLLSSQSNSLASTSLALESSESKVQKLRSRMAEMESSIDREMTHTITTLEHELQRLRDELIDRDAKESTQVTSLKQAVRDLERALQERAHEMELAVSKMAIAEKERATLQHLVRQQEEMLAQVQQHMTNRSDANANTATPTSITPQRYSLGPHSRQSLSLSSSKADATVGDVDDSNRISAAKRKSSSPTNTLLLTQPSSTLYPPLSSSRISAQFSPASRSCLFDNEIEPDEEEEEDEYQQFFQRARDEEAVEQQGTDNENESTTKRTSISPKTLSRSTSSSTRTSLAHDATQVAPSRSSNSFTRKRRSTLSIPDPSSPSPALAHSYASDGQVNSHQTAPSSASSSRSSKRQSTKTPESHRSSLHSLHRVVSSSSPTTH